ncbi:hypothetical protein [Falsiroseomonas tokyonensis]|uniref:Uncharacterized protein n=1 Tax=Falsiroseomonas tokyonensis TaxID=430521 RepID=A0ABV7BRM5_9PROT|nr:hypothetical protein [Falsiroseomonas tokyonensis]MBU8537313.1 hypothetical protein [Falsiroseomonas tokyonensis]
MTQTRTSREQLVFRRPFALPGLAQKLPAGTYTVEVEEELIEALSFPAWRRTSTTLTRRPERAGELIEAHAVTARDLEAAQLIDAA